MKSALGIVGSARRNGNTQLLVAKILAGAQEAGASTDMIQLSELKIQECNGCLACWKGKPCSKKDDMQGVYARIIASDLLVFGTPVYWYGPTALMKAVVDRFVFFNCEENRAKIRGKTALLAIPFEEEDLETAALVTAFFEKSLAYLEMKLAGQVLVPGLVAKGEISKRPETLAAAFELGRKTAQTLEG
jgi:multimeric flavodoxin WrbA